MNKLISRIMKEHPLACFFAVSAILGAVFVVLAVGLSFRYLLNSYLSGAAGLSFNTFLLFLSLGSALLAFSSYGRLYSVAWLGEKVGEDLRTHLFAHALKLPLKFYEKARVHEISTLLGSDIELLIEGIHASLFKALRNGLLFLGGIFLIFFLSLKLAFLIFLLLPLLIYPLLRLAKKMKHLVKVSQASIMTLEGSASEVLSAFKVVQAFNQQNREQENFKEMIKVLRGQKLSYIHWRGLLATAAILLLTLGLGVLLWRGHIEIVQGNLKAGDLTAFLFYGILIGVSGSALSETWGEMQKTISIYERITAFLNLPLSAPLKSRKKESALTSDILTIKDLRFAYDKDDFVLKDFTCSFKTGEKVALIGASGSGKTTLFNLLLRFYQASKGEIFLHNLPFDAYSLEEVREHFSIVFQEPLLFQKTLKENILYGAPQVTAEKIQEVLEKANLETVIQKLPEGIETLLGAKGAPLSGGEQQRVAIARALLKNPQILLLDEGTSALDVENEWLILKGLEDEIKAGMTLIMSTHRLSTLKQMDRILLLDEGRCVASGTHDTLLKESPFYQKLIRYFEKGK